jgi:toxin YoeB
MKDITFQGKCFKQYEQWSQENRDVFERINELILDVLRDPFKGISKPEPLK